MTTCDNCGKTDCYVYLRWRCEHGGVAFCFGGGDQMYVDPYCYALPFEVRRVYRSGNEAGKRGVVEFVGLHTPPTMRQYRAAIAAMRNSGWDVVRTRMRDGVPQKAFIGSRVKHA